MSSFLILVAEDNPINQKVVHHMLQKLGFKADFVRDGIEAVEAVRRTHYDIIFMDVMMPEMDGIDATGIIRSEEAPGSHVHIIALTASAQGKDRARCLAAGMDDYLSKPFMLDTLKEKLDRFMGPDFADDSVDPTLFQAFLSMMGDDDPVFLRELLSDFIADTDRLRSEVSAALDADDLQALRAAFHTLKSVCMVFGAAPLSTLCGRLETAAVEGRISEIADRMVPFESGLTQVHQKLGELLTLKMAH
jgi:CheY-like chemotaxis protein